MTFVDEAKNILLIGPSGTGKTHLAIAIGYAVTQKRIKTKFITMADLAIQMEAAETQNRLDSYIKKVINSARLLIIDEFGYFCLICSHSDTHFGNIRTSVSVLSGHLFGVYPDSFALTVKCSNG